MSYAESRSKLANLLIKAGYNVAKSLRAVRYPYVESYQMKHNYAFYDSFTEDIMQYQADRDKDSFETLSDGGFAFIDDKEYRHLGNKNIAKAHLYITSNRISVWQADGYNGTWWWSNRLTVTAKYRHKYPKDIIVDSFKSIGSPYGGVAQSEGEYGHQEGTIPLPEGGWLEVELPEEQAE